MKPCTSTYLKGRYEKIAWVLVLLLLLTGNPLFGQTKNISQFIHGNSLVKWYAEDSVPHPQPSTDLLSTPYWVAHMARLRGHRYQVAGEYGILYTHSTQDLGNNWTFDTMDYIGFEPGDTYSDLGITSVMFIVENWVQYNWFENQQGHPNQAFPWHSNLSFTDMALRIVDRARSQINPVTLYIYENWQPLNPDGTQYPFPLSPTVLNQYYTHAQGRIHQWWTQLQDEIHSVRPQANVKMIPAGSLLGKLRTQTVLRNLKQEDLYYDGAPHGTPTLYFLAALIHYMVIYQEPAPIEIGQFIKSDRQTQSRHYAINQLVLDNLPMIIHFIWTELQTYRFPNGRSRVFY
jgi:hypothetical protein